MATFSFGGADLVDNVTTPIKHNDKSRTSKRALLSTNKANISSFQCYKTWTRTQFILFGILIAVISAILSNIDRVLNVNNSSINNDNSEIYCYLGVYEHNQTNNNNNDDDFHWGYTKDTGPSIWSKYYPQCGCSSSQSPININKDYVMLLTPKQVCSDSDNLLQWIINDNYTRKYNGTFKVFHNGHTISIKSINNSTEPIAILNNLWQPINSSLHNRFILDNIHFHWGTNLINESGSSHTLYGKHYPLEAHFVHYSDDYDSLKEAMDDWMNLHVKQKDRYVLGVVSVFFSVDMFNNTINPVFDQLLSSNVLNSSNSDIGYIQQIDMNDLLPHDSQSYYGYSGSLTTPPCDPVVRWHVLSTPLPINQKQLEKFRSLAGEVVDYNWRPPQNNTNPVYACYADFV